MSVHLGIQQTPQFPGIEGACGEAGNHPQRVLEFYASFPPVPLLEIGSGRWPHLLAIWYLLMRFLLLISSALAIFFSSSVASGGGVRGGGSGIPCKGFELVDCLMDWLT